MVIFETGVSSYLNDFRVVTYQEPGAHWEEEEMLQFPCER